MQLEKYIDYTLLKAEATSAQIEKLCLEAIDWKLKAVCVNPCFLEKCSKLLSDTDVALCTVIGFPLGASFSDLKIQEAEKALAAGADELDMVINIGALKDKKDDIVLYEVESIAEIVKKRDKLLKVIIETAVLTDLEKERISALLSKSGADFIKTSTGFSTGGATVEDIRLIKRVVGDSMKIKASGGIKTRDFAIQLIDAGADRIGASSAKDIIFP